MSIADVCDIALEMFLHGSGVIFVRSDDVYNYTGCCCWRWSAGIATQGRTHTIYKKIKHSSSHSNFCRFYRNRKIYA
jgi:hypothetical protein